MTTHGPGISSEDFSQLSIPTDGDVVEYDDEFRPPDAPILPFAEGADGSSISAARRVLDAAADLTGREIHWLRVYVGEAARERYSNPLPADTVRALRKCRLGLVGTPAASRREAVRLEAELQRQVELTAAVDRRTGLEWLPSPLRGSHDVDLTVVRDVTEDAAAGVEYPAGSDETANLGAFLQETAEGGDRLPEEPAGYSVRPLSAAGTESLVDTAMAYALDQDCRTVTLVHQGDRLPGSEGAFLEWAEAYLEDEYDDAIVDEQAFDELYDGQYPEDEVVILRRQTDELCRDLLTRPEAYDVVVCPALAGVHVSAIAAEATGGVGVAPGVAIGDGRVVATPQSGRQRGAVEATENPIGALRSCCLLFEYIGWEDTSAVVRDALASTLADGVFPRDVRRRSVRGTPVDAAAFADAVVERLDVDGREPGSGGVQTTADERAGICRIIAGLYNAVFEDQVSPRDIELNQLLGEDEEADIYLPEVGLNFYYWRQWSTERRLEVLLHELAHVEEEDGERDHGDEFYDRLVEVTDIAAEWRHELEALFGEPIDFDQVRRFVVESVHEETIEADLETVEERQQTLCERFGLDGDDYD